MPSAASAKPEKAPSAEASGAPPPAAGGADISPVRQILVIIEHKIRNLEKRKSKLTSYRDLQKSGKELNADQKEAVAKYDEVMQTLEFAREMCKQVTGIAVTSERDAKRQAKKEAWIRTAAETAKIRDVLLVQDVLVQMGNSCAREDFLQGTNGAAKLTQENLKILDDLYPEVTPRHEPNEEGSPAFPTQAIKAAEHLYSIIDGRQKEILGTTYAHIKEIVTAVHQCGYFDKIESENIVVEEEQAPLPEPVPEEPPHLEEVQPSPPLVYPPPPHTLPSPAPLAPAPGVVPAPAYPLRPLPPITLQEVEHAYFTQQYAQQRPITEVIGSQNFFFLQESEIDSPSSTPQPVAQTSPPGPIHTQTFTNQSFIQMGARVAPDPGVLPPQPHFSVPAELAAYPVPGLPPRGLPHPLERLLPQPVPHTVMHPAPPSPPLREEPVQQPPPTQQVPAQPAPTQPAPPHSAQPAPEVVNNNDDEWSESPERDDDTEQPQGDGDSQNRYRRPRKYNRGSNRGESNGFRGRGSYRQSGDYQPRQNDNYQGRHNDNYQGRPNNGYQGRHNDGYQPRQNDGYQARNNDEYPSRRGDNYHGRQNNDSHHTRQNNGSYQRRDDNYQPRNNSRNRNGDTGNDNGTRDKFEGSQGGFQGGFKSRGRGGGPRGGFRSGPPRSARPPPPFASKQTTSSEQ